MLTSGDVRRHGRDVWNSRAVLWTGISTVHWPELLPVFYSFSDSVCVRRSPRQHEHWRARPSVRVTNIIRGVSRFNVTEKNSMDRRKDDMHESRNVVSFFFEQWYQPVATTGAIGPPGPSTCVGARRPELVQPAGATVALHEHSEVHAALHG